MYDFYEFLFKIEECYTGYHRKMSKDSNNIIIRNKIEISYET